ncbi:FCHSD2 (predicted) [Pycnogonum litorale]
MSMQPPPRRAKLLAAVRATQNQQLCQLQTKHHYDTELLDDLRSFTNKRAQIERDYSHALLKLSSTYLQKKVPNIPEAKLTNRSTIYSVWRTTLDETEKLAKAHLASAEVFQQQISDSAKSVKNAKMHAAKKCFETMRKMQEGIHQDYVEMEKIKKLYFEEEHLAHCARDKAYVAEEKLKRKKGKIFQSLTSLQKNSSKFSYKREACDTRATSTRNQYLMWIAALNAHLARYHELELPELMKTIDGQYYEKVAEYLTTLSRTELLTCSATQNSYSNVLQQAAKISRYEDLQTFLSKHPTVGNKQEYKFEPCDEDKVTSISAEYNAGHFLTSDAKKWSLCYLKECRVLKQQNDILKDLYKGDGTQASQSSMSDSNGQPRSIDVEVKIDDVSDIIRRAEISKLKAWARLEVLRNSGIPVDEYLQFSDTDSIESFEHSTDDKAKSSSSQSDKVRLESVSEAENKSELDESYESDFQDTSSEMSVPKEEPAAVDVAPNSEHKSEEADTKSQRDSLRSDRPESIIFPSCRCIALFQYEASNSDELTIAEQEVLDIVGEGDGDGWVRARNSNGIEGYIPQNYVEVENGLEVPRSIHPAPVSFSSVDYSVEEEDRLTNGFLPLTLEQQTADTGVQFCRALYDYEATCEEELTFFEGQIIKVLKTTVNDVDDGWWEGEINDQVGLFPSLVVEMLKNSGEPHTPVDLEFTTPGIAPPAYTPPKPSLLLPPSQVIITQPTPQTENSSEDAVTFSVKKDDFEMELTNDQQAQYRSQFSSSESDGSMDVSATVTEKQPGTGERIREYFRKRYRRRNKDRGYHLSVG